MGNYIRLKMIMFHQIYVISFKSLRQHSLVATFTLIVKEQKSGEHWPVLDSFGLFNQCNDLFTHQIIILCV